MLWQSRFSSVGAQPSASAFRPRREYLDSVRNIARAAQGADAKFRQELVGLLRDLESRIPASWHDGEMLAELGAAYANAGSFEEAVRTYRAAVNHPGAGAPIVAVEQLANLEDRHATQLMQDAARATGPERDEIRKRAIQWTEEAIHRAEGLLTLGETSERLSLLGGAYKRRAWVNRTAGDFEKSAEYYGQAARLQPSLVYPALNEATVRFLAGGADNYAILATIGRAESDAKKYSQEPAHEQDIWKRVARPDAMLFEAFVRGNLPQAVEGIEDLYKTAIKGEDDWRTLASIRSQIEMFRDFATDDAVKAALERLIALFQL